MRVCSERALPEAGGHLWRAEHIHPAGAPLFRELRRRLGLRPHPPLILGDATGEIDPRSQPCETRSW